MVLEGLLKSSEALAALGQHPKVSPAQGPPQHGLGPLWCKTLSLRKTLSVRGASEQLSGEDSWIMERNQGS